MATLEQQARDLGTAHGSAGQHPFGNGPDPYNDDGGALMRALGITTATTDANAPARLALLDAYWDAYDAASKATVDARRAGWDAERESYASWMGTR